MSGAHPGHAQHLARDNGNATSENCIETLKGSRCLKGKLFYSMSLQLPVSMVVWGPCVNRAHPVLLP